MHTRAIIVRHVLDAGCGLHCRTSVIGLWEQSGQEGRARQGMGWDGRRARDGCVAGGGRMGEYQACIGVAPATLAMIIPTQSAVAVAALCDLTGATARSWTEAKSVSRLSAEYCDAKAGAASSRKLSLNELRESGTSSNCRRRSAPEQHPMSTDES